MYELIKITPVRSRKYTEFVKSLKCVVTGLPAEVGHHVISGGLGGTMGGKCSDIWQIPLTDKQHEILHHNVGAWEEEHGLQIIHAVRVVDLAFSIGLLTVKGSRS